MRQLEVFEEMGANIDPNNELWRKYKLSLIADRMQAGRIECQLTIIQLSQQIVFKHINITNNYVIDVLIYCYFHSILIMGVIQMMLPVLSSEYFVYHHMQNTAVVQVMVDCRKYDNSDFAVVRDMI